MLRSVRVTAAGLAEKGLAGGGVAHMPRTDQCRASVRHAKQHPLGPRTSAMISRFPRPFCNVTATVASPIMHRAASAAARVSVDLVRISTRSTSPTSDVESVALEANPLVVALGVFKSQAVAPQSVDHLATAVDEPDVMPRGCQPTAKDAAHSARADDRDFHA